MISGYTREAGVRNLERKIGEICRKAAREIYQGDKTKIKITESNLEKYLGKEKYSFDKANEQDEIGIVRGLGMDKRRWRYPADRGQCYAGQGRY